MKPTPRLAIVLIGAALVACSKKSDTAPSYSLQELWVESSSVQFNDHQDWVKGEQETKEAREVKVIADPEFAPKCKGEASARENIEAAGTRDEFTTVTMYCKDDKGVAHFATQVPSQNQTQTYEPKYELLSQVKIGQTWSATHGEGVQKNTRSCVVEATRYCEEGVATVCITEKEAGALTWLRQHYCKGDGWRGYEAVMVRAGAVFMRGWSSDVVVDGQKRANAGEPKDLPDAAKVASEAARIRES